jgi:hypothetical protein
MRHLTIVALLTAGLVIASLASPRAESPVSLTVRLYNSAGIAPSDIDLARTVAGPILRETGVEVTFRRCARLEAGVPVDRCDDPLKASEVVVRLIDAPHFNLAQSADVLGVAYVVPDSNRGWLATLYADRIAGAAARTDLDRGTLLGRVMAHEIGHLLIGLHYHGPTGVMRAEWSEELLERSDEAEWRFSSLELSAMQRVLSSLSP